MGISIIVAMDKKRLIGRNGDLPWHLPNDLEYFRNVTMGHMIVMGRKTFEAIGKPLDGRKNVVLTREVNYKAEGIEVVHSIKEVLSKVDNNQEIFIIGGGEIYKQFLPYADKLYITKIDYEFEGDTYFPNVNSNEWEKVSIKKGITDELNPYNYYFNIYKRKKDH